MGFASPVVPRVSYSQPGNGGQRKPKKLQQEGKKEKLRSDLPPLPSPGCRNGNSEGRGRGPGPPGPRVIDSTVTRGPSPHRPRPLFLVGAGRGFDSSVALASCLRALEADGPPSPRNLSWKLVLKQCRVRIGLVGNENDNDNDGDFFQ